VCAFACGALARPAVKSDPGNGQQGEKARVGIGAYFQRDKEKGDTLSVKSLLKGSPAQMCNQVCRACLSERRAPPRRCGAGARAAATEPR